MGGRGKARTGMVHGGVLDGGKAKWAGGGEQGNVTGVRDGGLCVCIVSAG